MLDWLRNRLGLSKPRKKAKPARSAIVDGKPSAVSVSTPPCDPGNPRLIALEQDYFALLLGVDAVVDRPLIKLEHQALEALVQLVKDSVSLSSQVPRLPTLLPKLMQSLHDRNKSSKELAKLIRGDPAVVAEVLRTANSPYYRTRSEIRDIEHAILILGASGLRETVARIAIRPVVQFDSGLYNQNFAPRIWEQANKCAGACSVLAVAVEGDRFNAFLAGLMHNIGAAVVFRVLNRLLGKAPPPACERFRVVMDAVIPHLTHRVASEWALPEPVVAALHPKDRSTPLSKVVDTGARLAKLHTLVAAERYLPDTYDTPWIYVPELSNQQAACFAELDRAVHLLGSAN